MKATHTGHCQLCGREQKLPNGLLSKHGYAVEWSRFIGTCPGSGFQPYELSYDLIADARQRALWEAERLENMAAEDEADTSHFWIHEYRSAKRVMTANYTFRTVQAHFEWVRYLPDALVVSRIEGSTDTREYVARYIDEAGKAEQITLYPSTTPAETVVKLNAKRAAFLRKEAQGMREYANWLQTRIDTWQEAPLTAIGA